MVSIETHPSPNDILRGNSLSRIAVFGTSANPPTGDSGHCGIVRYMVQSGKFDEIWILPVYIHMFASKRTLESYDHRVTMCKLCMEPLSSPTCKVRVLTLEKHVYEVCRQMQLQSQQTSSQQKSFAEPRIGTIDIVRFIKSTYENIELHLILGTDTCHDLLRGKWRESEAIVKEVILEIVSRPGCDNENLAFESLPLYPMARISFHKVKQLGNVSSTAVRGYEPTDLFDWNVPDYLESCFGQGENIAKESLAEPVYNYIRDNHLYYYSPQRVAERKKLKCQRSIAILFGPIVFGAAAAFFTMKR